MSSISNSAAQAEQASQPVTPETFRLPSIGRDPHFGFSRSTYLRWGRAGKIRLFRLKSPGQVRPSAVLVSYADVKRFIESSEVTPIAPTNGGAR